MELKSMLFIFGAILFIVGLIGQIRAKEIEVGTTNKTIRICSFVFGLVFIALAITLPSSKPDEADDKHPTNDESTVVQDDPLIFADATYMYWEKCQTNDDFYSPKLVAQNEILKTLLKDVNSTYRSRGDAYYNYAKILEEYANSEGALSVINVDSELVEYFTRLRGYFRQEAALCKQYSEIYYGLGPSSDQEEIDSAWKKFNEFNSEYDSLYLKLRQHADEREVLKQKLSKKYGREFIDRERI